MTDGFDNAPRNSFDSWLLTRNDGLVTLVENSSRELIGHIVIDKTNKHTGFVKKEDLERAVHCLQVMKERKMDRGYKIGVIRKPIDGINSYAQDEIVLYREGDDKTVVVESPMTEEQISKNQETGSLITTYKTTVCVPAEYVQEIN